MGKFLRNLTDGTLRCRYCGDSECNCMEDGKTKLEFVTIWKDTGKARLVQLRKQVLANGKRIPSGINLWIPNVLTYKIDLILKTIVVDNKQINKMVFD